MEQEIIIQVGTIIKWTYQYKVLDTNNGKFSIEALDGDLKGKIWTDYMNIDALKQDIKDGLCQIISQPKQSNNMTQTISRAGMKKIYDVACSTWQDKIKALTLKYACPFSNNVDLPQVVVDEMFKAASATQTTVLKKYFKEVNVFDSTMLTDGQMMRVDKIGSYPNTKYLLKAYGALVGFDNMGKYTTTWDTDLKTKGTKMASGSEFTLTVK